MSYHSHHRILTPGASRKRKETEVFYSVQPSTTPPSPQPTSSSAQAAAADPISSNQILAGYMAYEFLTKGTLFGQKFDPARANALPLSPTSAAATDLKKTKLNQNTVAAEPNNRAAPVKQHESYTEVASLLKADGAHIPGIVNPTQLARWIQM